MKKTRKPLKLNQVKALYDAGLKAYSESYAMMIDDALIAVIRKAKDKGYDVGVYSDGGLFPTMYLFISSFRSWKSIPEHAKARFVELSKY